MEQKELLTVIVADDETELREAVCSVIPWKEIGFRLVGSAGNGLDALQLVEQLQPDLLLTDIRMPYISGVSLAQQVRELGLRGCLGEQVVRRADGVPAYNLAAVVDDAFQGVDQVVRGFDLLSQAPAQAQLAHLLGAPEPTYAHVPLALAPSGARLAKRDGAVTLSDLRGLGWSTEDVVSFIGSSLGVPGARCASDIADALGITGLRSLPTEPWIVTPPSS